MKTTAIYSSLTDSKAAGKHLGDGIAANFEGESPDVVIVFASSKHDYAALLEALDESCKPGLIVGCSSAGEFIGGARGEGATSAVALRAPEMKFSAGVGEGLRGNPEAAAGQVAAAFKGASDTAYKHRAALILTDALAGYTDAFVERLSVLTAGRYRFFGGGAGDDAKFRRTHVFFGRRVLEDAVVGLEILSNKPLGIGARHGWEPAGEPMRVTESQGMRLVSLNAFPAVEAFRDHAKATGQKFDAADPISFFLHNCLGISTPDGFKLRVPLAVEADGSVVCASDIPAHSTVHIMKATPMSAVQAASAAVKSAMQQIEGNKPKVALFFDCVATRLRVGQDFGMELQALQTELHDAPFGGCNTYGQIVRADGQFNGFHNCTAVVCVFPE